MFSTIDVDSTAELKRPQRDAFTEFQLLLGKEWLESPPRNLYDIVAWIRKTSLLSAYEWEQEMHCKFPIFNNGRIALHIWGSFSAHHQERYQPYNGFGTDLL